MRDDLRLRIKTKLWKGNYVHHISGRIAQIALQPCSIGCLDRLLAEISAALIGQSCPKSGENRHVCARACMAIFHPPAKVVGLGVSLNSAQ
jgi:hypothetical protein